MLNDDQLIFTPYYHLKTIELKFKIAYPSGAANVVETGDKLRYTQALLTRTHIHRVHVRARRGITHTKAAAR